MIELERAASDAIDEIERLRERLTLQEMGARSLVDILENEIERLRDQVEAMKGYIRKAHERDGAEIERMRGFISWILESYDKDEWPAQKDIVTGAREVLGIVDH
jgi:hypothetical protein